MPRTYAIADLHGRFDLLARALEAISARDDGSAYKVVTLGDYVDRGPESREIIQHLMNAQAGDRPLICLKGNHEDIMVRALGNPALMGWWLDNGGGQTLLSYGHTQKGPITPEVVPVEHVRWIESLPLFHEDANRVFVHAWAHHTTPLSEQIDLQCYHGEPALFWTLYPDDDEGGHLGKHVVHGHHQHAHGPILKSGRTNLDTFAWYSGRLVVGVFDDEKAGGPIDTIEVVGEPVKQRMHARNHYSISRTRGRR